MIYALVLSGIAGYVIRAILGVWKEQHAWQLGHLEGRQQARRDMADAFEDLCTEEIATRDIALRDKQEVSDP